MTLRKTLWSLTSIRQGPYKSTEGIRSTKHMSDILHILSFSSPHWLSHCFSNAPDTSYLKTVTLAGLSAWDELPPSTHRTGSLLYFLPGFSQIFPSLWTLSWPTYLKFQFLTTNRYPFTAVFSPWYISPFDTIFMFFIVCLSDDSV